MWTRFMARLADQTVEDFEVDDYVTVHVDRDHRFHAQVEAIEGGRLTVKRWDDGSRHLVAPTSVSSL